MEDFNFLNSFLFPYLNLVVFLVLAFLILRKPFVGAIEAKRESFDELLKKASQAKEAAERRNQELKDRLAALDKEVEDMKLSAKKQAEEEALAIVQNAEHLAEHLKKEAKRIADAEVASAKGALQELIVEQVRKLTVEELKKSLDGQQHQKVFQEGIKGLSQVRVEGQS